MKRVARLSILVFSLVITQLVFGQMRAGLTAGANIATVSTDFDAAEYGGRVLFALGGIFEIELSDRMSLRIEPMYLQKGADPHFDFQRQEVRHKNFVDYLELPILLAYSFAATESLTPYITLGPSIGFKLGADFHALLPGGHSPPPGPASTPVDISEDIKLIDVGIAVGAGMRIRSGKGSFFIVSRYSIGLTNIYDFPYTTDCFDCVGPVELNNRGLQVLAGYTFPLGTNRSRLR